MNVWIAGFNLEHQVLFVKLDFEKAYDHVIESFCFIYWRDVVLERDGEVVSLIVFQMYVSLSLPMGRL